MNAFPSFLLLSVLISISSCSYKTEGSMELAHENSSELKSVLTHYRNDKDKLEAAKYLISNMQYHGTIEDIKPSPNEFKNRFLLVDSFLKQHIIYDSIVDKKHYAKLFKRNGIKQIDLSEDNCFGNFYDLSMDVRTVSSSYLINNIDVKFEVWRNTKKLGIDKKLFFEAILPYRSHTEAIQEDSIIQCKTKNLFEHDLSQNQIQNSLFNYFIGFRAQKGKLKLDCNHGFYDILTFWGSDCVNQARYSTTLLRNSGYPSFLEFTPQWKDRIANRRHFWCSMLNAEGGFSVFSPGGARDESNSIERATKVFRYTYSINEHTPFFLKRANEFIPIIFDTPYIKDVSNCYLPTKKLNIKTDSTNKECNFCYLATFNPPHWQPVDYALLNSKNKKTTFKNAQTSCLYAVIQYNQLGQYNLITEPFYFNKQGKAIFLKPNLVKKQKIKIYQKYPAKKSLITQTSNLKGSVIQISSDRFFKNSRDIYIIDEINPIVKEVKLPNEKARYARIINMSGEPLNLAIFEFHSYENSYENQTIGKTPYLLSRVSDDSVTHLNRATKLYCEPISSIKKKTNNWTKNESQKVLDSKMDTYTMLPEIAFDFKEEVELSSFRFAPRNANNWINKNDQYELYFWHNGCWNLHDIKTANFNFIEFEGVPSETLYWLKNTSKGKEELAFLYYEGKQYFINYDDVEQFFQK